MFNFWTTLFPDVHLIYT